MTLQWKPTAGHTYKVYQIVNGTRRLIGQTTGGTFTPQHLAKGEYHFVVTVVNANGESRPSNDIVFRQKNR